MSKIIGPAIAAGAVTALTGGFGAVIAAGSIGAFAGGVSLASVATSAGLAAASAGLQLATAKKSGGIAPTSSFVQRTPVYLPDVYGDCRVGAAAAYYRQSTDASNNDLLTVWVLAGHPIEEVSEIRYGDALMWTPLGGLEADFDGRAVVAVQLGHDATPTPPADLLAGADGVLDSDFKLKGKPYVYIRFQKVTGRKTKWPEGIDPGRLWYRVKGKRVYDPRTEATAYSANWALCFRDWLIARGGLSAAQFTPAQIIAAANLCDENVSLGGSPETFQNRYRVHGAFRSEVAPRELIGDWLRQGGNLRGLVNTGATLAIVPGAYTAPVATFGPDDFLEPVRLEPEAKVEDRYDGVRSTFAAPGRFYNATDANTVLLDDYSGAAEDARVLELEYARETSRARAVRLGLLALRQSRRVQKVSFAVPLNAANAALLPGQRLNVSLPPAGISGVFEIVERRTVLDAERPRVEIVALEDDSDFWGWTAETATAAPDGLTSTLPNPFFVAPPTGVTATGFTRVEPDGSVTRWIDVSWTAPAAEPFLDRYRVQWEQGGETRDAETTATRYRINNVSTAAATITVFTVNTLGRESAGVSPAAAVTPGGDATPPGPPPSGAIFPVASGFRFVMGNPTDADLAGLRVYQGASGAAFGATSAVRDVPATPGGEETEFTLGGFAAATTRRFFVTAFDRSGNESTAFGPLEATTPTALTTEEIDAAIAAAEAIATEALADAEAALTQVGVVTSAVSDVEADLAAEVTNRIAAIATETAARAASEQALEARVAGPNMVARGAVNAATTQAEVNEAWTGVILGTSGATNFALLQDGKYLQIENGDRSRTVHRYNPNGRKFRATGIAFNPTSPGNFSIGLRRPDSTFLNGIATVRPTGATFWLAFDVEWTCTSDAPDFVVGFFLDSGHFAGVADLVVTDVTDTDATLGAASIRTLATTKVDEAGAVAAVNAVVAAEGAPGIATVQALTTAYSQTEGALGAAYMLRAKAGGSAAEFELVAFDDVEGGGSAIRLDADLIILDGTVTAEKLNVTDLSAISANLGSIVVGEANIGSLAVTTLKIAGEAVTTGKIGANAVSKPYSASGSGNTGNIMTVVMDAPGTIIASVSRRVAFSNSGGTTTLTFRLLIDGAEVDSRTISSGDVGRSDPGAGGEYITLGARRDVGSGNRIVRIETSVSGGTLPTMTNGPFSAWALGRYR